MMKRLFAYMAAMCIAGGVTLSAQAADAYIDTDGSQTVVLDYYVKPNTKIVADYAFLAVTPTQQRVFAASGREAGMSCAHYINGGGNYAFAFRNGDGDWQNTAVPVTTDRRTFEIDGPNKKARLYTDGELTKEMNTSTPTVPSVYPLGLFATIKNEEGTYFENPGSKVRLYSLQIYESGTLVMDLQPVLKNGVYLLKDAVTGKTYGPIAGNPLTGGGDITVETSALMWVGMGSSEWNVAANWQDAGGAAPAFPPQAGDEVVIPAGSTVDISGAMTVKSLTLTGSGTVTLSGSNAKQLADSLAVDAGVTLALAADTTVYVPSVTAGGASVPSGRYAGGSQSWLAGDGALNVNSAGQSVAGGVLTLDVPAGQTLAYYTQLSSAITKIVKIGAGTAIVSNDNNTAFSGTVEIREGILEAQSGAGGKINTFGGQKANTITVSKGAQLRVLAPNSYPNQSTERFPNALVIAGNGPDGYGALRMVKTSQPVGGSVNIDRLFTTVTLSDDASVYSSSRVGFSSGTVDLGGHTLTTRPVESGGNMFMLNSCTLKNGSCVAKNAADVITQGTLSLQGTVDNTLTVEKGSQFSMWNTQITRWDWTLIQKGGSLLRAGSGTAADRNRILGPIILDGGTVTVTNYTPSNPEIRMNLAGPISGTGKMFHNGSGHAYLMNGANTWTGGLQVNWGTVWGTTTGSIPHGQLRASGSGKINFVAKDWDHAALHNVLTNWDGSGAVNVYTASGENVTDSTDFEHTTYYRHGGPGTLTFTADTTPEGKSGLINGEGEMVVAGDKTRRLTQLNVLGGTMTLENAGRICSYEWDVVNNRRGATNKTWTVGGTNTNAPARMVVKSGTVLDAFVPSSGSASHLRVQDSGTKGAILEVHDGAAVTNWIGVGYDANTKGAFYQYGGKVRNICCNGYDGYAGRYANSYGFVDLMGGELAMRSWWRFGGHPTAVGVMRMSGGTFTAEGSQCLSFGGWGELYMTGGTLNGGATVHLGESHWGDKTPGEFDTIRGTLTLGGEGNPQATYTSWVDMCERTNTFTGVVNMNAGVLSTPSLQKAEYVMATRDNERARAFVNFGGGTWQAYADHAAIFGSGGRAVNRVTVFPGGATLDINGKSSSNGAVPFEKPFGKGVASIAWPAGTSTNSYIGPPEVYITGGGGTGAVAHCTFDARTGTIGEIVVASPGWGYTSAPTATIKSADRKTTITCAVTLTDGEEQPGGGLMLTNSSATAGTFTLSAANTYTGPTVVAGGTLKLGAADAIPSANELRLAGGTFDAASYDVSYARVGGYGTLKGNVTVTDKLVFDAAQPSAAGLAVNGTLTLGSGVTVEIANTNLLARGTTYTLATFPTPLASVPASNLTRPWCVFLTNGGKTLLLSASAPAATLARQCGAFGIVTYDPLPVTETQTTPVPVPYAWLDAHVPGVAHESEAYEAAAMATAANGRKVWECYALGLDPQVATSDFRIASFPMKTDGTPDFANVVFDPPRNQWNVPDAPVVWKGAATLEGPWRTVTTEGGSAMRFFKAVVFGNADDEHDGVQLWEGGPYWATKNVGAEKPWDYGYYFWWGDTVGYTRSGGTWNDYFGDGSGYYSGVTWVSSTGEQMSSSPFSSSSCPTYGKGKSALLSAGYIDSTTNLVAAHDAATAHLGAPWRMPTVDEIDALISNCTTTWITTNGVSGRLVTGTGAYANRSIFLPAAGCGGVGGRGEVLDELGMYGYYWSSTPLLGNSNYAWGFIFNSGDFGQYSNDCYCGQPIRPVRGLAP